MKKEFIKVEIKNSKEMNFIKSLVNEGVKVYKGFNSLIISPAGGLKKSSNKYLNLLKAAATLQQLGFTYKIIKF